VTYCKAKVSDPMNNFFFVTVKESFIRLMSMPFIDLHDCIVGANVDM